MRVCGLGSERVCIGFRATAPIILRPQSPYTAENPSMPRRNLNELGACCCGSSRLAATQAVREAFKRPAQPEACSTYVRSPYRLRILHTRNTKTPIRKPQTRNCAPSTTNPSDLSVHQPDKWETLPIVP